MKRMTMTYWPISDRDKPNLNSCPTIEHLSDSQFLIFEMGIIVSQRVSGSSAGKESTYNAGDSGLIPKLGRSTGEGIGYPLQYSSLENSMDYITHGVTKSQTQLSNFHFHLSLKSKLSGKSEQLEATQKISKELKPRSFSFGLFMPVHLL